MATTYSTAPFIALDAPDADKIRAEVRVVHGCGKVVNIETKDGKKAANIFFENAKNDHPINGHIPLTDPVYDILKDAYENGEVLYYRLESVRKPGVDRSKPYLEISPPRDMNAAKENIFKNVAAVKRLDDPEWTLAETARTNIQEYPEPPYGGIHSAAHMSLDELRGSTMLADTPDTNPATSSGVRGEPGDDGWHEPAPYVTWINRRDGVINPGSNAVSAPINIYFFAAQYAKDNGIEASPEQVQTVSKAILAVCNTMQRQIYKGKLTEPDLSAGSHTRARGLVFELTRSECPLTAEEFSDPAKLKAWMPKITKTGLQLWAWGMNLAQKA